MNDNIIKDMEYTTITEDQVNHPSHYTDGNIEVIDYIFDKGWGESFCKGNAIKYISRAGKKKSGSLNDNEKEIQDLEKAIWYIQRYVDYLKGEVE